MIGIVFIIPFFYFFYKKKMNQSLIKKLLFIFFLGGLQGALGWFMVKSGLQDNPHVSHYRLAAHLFTAFLTYAFTLWVALDFTSRSSSLHLEKGVLIKILSRTILIFVLLQIIYGAFVAGLKAGLIYNTFPKMGNLWIPDGIWLNELGIKNFSENLITVQFIHRAIAWMLLILIAVLFFTARKFPLNNSLRFGINFLSFMLLIQFTLGDFTLLFSVPVFLGVLHQIGGFLFFTSAVFVNHRVKKNVE